MPIVEVGGDRVFYFSGPTKRFPTPGVVGGFFGPWTGTKASPIVEDALTAVESETARPVKPFDHLYTETFDKADGALGPVFSWTRRIFTAAPQCVVVGNECRFESPEGVFEDIQVPNIAIPNGAKQTIKTRVTEISYTAAGGAPPIAIRGGTPATTVTTGDPISVTLTGTRQPQAGDVLLIIDCNNFYTLADMPTPTVDGSAVGVTSIVNADGGTDSAHIKSWFYVVGSTGDLTVAVDETGAADEEKGLAVYVLDNVDTTDPIEDSAAAINTGGLTHIAPSVSPTVTTAFLICHANNGGAAAPASYTSPGTMTEAYDNAITSFCMVGATEQLAASGPTGTRTFIPNTSITGNAEISIALKPAAAPGTGSYWISGGSVLRFQQVGEHYTGYAAAIGRNNQIIPGVPIYFIEIWRINGPGVPPDLINSAGVAEAGIALPGVFEFHVDGDQIGAFFTHSGTGPVLLAPDVTDATHSSGLIAIGVGNESDVGESGAFVLDNFQIFADDSVSAAIGPAIETETAQPVGRKKTKAVGRRTLTESFNKADGALGPDLAWTRAVFTGGFPYTVVTNEAKAAANTAGTWDDIQIPAPNVDAPDVEFSFDYTAVSLAGTGDYETGVGGVARFLDLGAGSYRGYSFNVGRNNTFFAGVDLWHILLFRVDAGVLTQLGVGLWAAATATLPGVLKVSFVGDHINCRLEHSGPGATLSILEVIDSTYTSGLATLYAHTAITGTRDVSNTIDNVAVVSFPNPVVETETAQTITPTLSGGITQIVGQALETETAFIVARKKLRVADQVFEIETGQAVALSKLRLVAQALETETAVAIARSKLRLVGQSLETETGQAFARVKLRLIAEALETETAQPISQGNVRVVAQALETETGQAFTRTKLRVVGQSLETETAFTVAQSKVRLVAQALETETAQSIVLTVVGFNQPAVLALSAVNDVNGLTATTDRYTLTAITDQHILTAITKD